MAGYLDNAYDPMAQPISAPQMAMGPPMGTNLTLTPEMIQRVLAEIAARQQPPVMQPGPSVLEQLQQAQRMLGVGGQRSQ